MFGHRDVYLTCNKTFASQKEEENECENKHTRVKNIRSRRYFVPNNISCEFPVQINCVKWTWEPEINIDERLQRNMYVLFTHL